MTIIASIPFYKHCWYAKGACATTYSSMLLWTFRQLRCDLCSRTTYSQQYILFSNVVFAKIDACVRIAFLTDIHSVQIHLLYSMTFVVKLLSFCSTASATFVLTEIIVYLPTGAYIRRWIYVGLYNISLLLRSHCHGVSDAHRCKYDLYVISVFFVFQYVRKWKALSCATL